ncbi:hypothetical protein CDIK_1360 [Cucumispora dikerogammari]|nr:hypothetical protein CDIK_1360 [Cucumispora dikerogammari]
MIFRYGIPLIMTNILISNLFNPVFLIYSIIFSCVPMFISMKTSFYTSNILTLAFLLTGKLPLVYASYGIILSTVYGYCSRLIITKQKCIFKLLIRLDAFSIIISIPLNIFFIRQFFICLTLFQFINIFYYSIIPIDLTTDENIFLPKTLKKITPFVTKNLTKEYKKILEVRKSTHNVNYKFIIYNSFLLFIPFTNNLYLKFFICFGIFIPVPKSIIGNILVVASIIFEIPLLGFFGSIFSQYKLPETWNSSLIMRFIVLKLVIMWGFTSIFY